MQEKEEKYGTKVAKAAFEAMDKEKEVSESIASEAEAFVEECDKAGRNPIEVVKFVAKEAGIELSGPRPEDREKCMSYDLLREVVDIVVERVFECDEGEEEDDEDDPTILVAKSCPVRKTRNASVFGYAFSW